MALSYKVLAMGERGSIVNAWADSKTGISAAGTTQGTATALDNGVNVVSTVASGTGVALSVNGNQGDTMTVANTGANPLKIYPQSGAQINALGLNNPMILPVNSVCTFVGASTTLWLANLSA